MERRAHRFNYKIEEGEREWNENSCFRGGSRTGKVSYNNGEIEHDQYKMHGKLCKVGFYEFYIEHEIAERVYCREKENIPEIFRFENLVAVRVRDSDKRIEDHNDECEIKARMT